MNASDHQSDKQDPSPFVKSDGAGEYFHDLPLRDQLRHLETYYDLPSARLVRAGYVLRHLPLGVCLVVVWMWISFNRGGLGSSSLFLALAAGYFSLVGVACILEVRYIDQCRNILDTIWRKAYGQRSLDIQSLAAPGQSNASNRDKNDAATA